MRDLDYTHPTTAEEARANVEWLTAGVTIASGRPFGFSSIRPAVYSDRERFDLACVANVSERESWWYEQGLTAES